MKNKGTRIVELDLAKSFTIIIAMIGIHTYYHLADYEMTPLVSVINVLATAWAAPVFMFCMGLTLGFAHKQQPLDRLKRGIRLITIGMVLNVLRYGPFAFRAAVLGEPEELKGLALIFNDDILQFAGLSLILLALCKRLKMNSEKTLLLGLVLNIAGTLLDGHYTNSYVVNQMLGYFYPTPTCSCFPLFNWFIFVAAGNLMGKIYRKTDDIGKFYRIAIPVCGIIALVHQYLSITLQVPFFRTLQNDWCYYSMHTADALCIAFGVIPFELGLFWLLAKIIPDSWGRYVNFPAVHINQFFCISWVWICWTADFLLFVPKAANDAEFIAMWFIIVVLTILSSVIYTHKIRYRVVPFYVKHSTPCIILIWVFVLLFGVIYFSNVNGPYIMPY